MGLIEPIVKRNVVFKWKRVEGQGDHPVSFNSCATGGLGFLGYEKISLNV